MNEIEPKILTDFFITCNQKQNIEWSYLNNQLTKLQHKTKIDNLRNKCIEDGKSFLNSLVTIESTIVDITLEAIRLRYQYASYKDVYLSDYSGTPWCNEKSGVLHYHFLYSKKEFSKILLDYSKNEYVSITGKIVWITNGICGIDFGIPSCKPENDSNKYTIIDYYFHVYLELISIEKKDPPKTTEGCFIATAVYDDYDSPEVLLFRSFRDEFLKRSFFGRFFIKIYYSISPFLAKQLKKSNILKKIIKKLFLSPLFNLIKKGV